MTRSPLRNHPARDSPGDPLLPHQSAGANLDDVRTLLNIIWFIFSGFWLWLAYMLAGIICCVLIITIPWGIASFRMANYAAWPFGRELVDKPNSGIFSFLGNVIWVIVAGWCVQWRQVSKHQAETRTSSITRC